MRPLTKTVVDHLTHEGTEVLCYAALEIPDNLDVAAHDPARPPVPAEALDHSGADAVVLSACVQMPLLGAIEEAGSGPYRAGG